MCHRSLVSWPRVVVEQGVVMSLHQACRLGLTQKHSSGACIQSKNEDNAARPFIPWLCTIIGVWSCITDCPIRKPFFQATKLETRSPHIVLNNECDTVVRWRLLRLTCIIIYIGNGVDNFCLNGLQTSHVHDQVSQTRWVCFVILWNHDRLVEQGALIMLDKSELLVADRQGKGWHIRETQSRHALHCLGGWASVDHSIKAPVTHDLVQGTASFSFYMENGLM